MSTTSQSRSATLKSMHRGRSGLWVLLFSTLLVYSAVGSANTCSWDVRKLRGPMAFVDQQGNFHERAHMIAIAYPYPNTPMRVFYGFATQDAALDPMDFERLRNMRAQALHQVRTEMVDGNAYVLPMDGEGKWHIHLVAAPQQIPILENLQVRIEPIREMVVKAIRNRGASDFPGPLPAQVIAPAPEGVVGSAKLARVESCLFNIN